MPPIRAICFDLDNTLWDVFPVIMRAERAMYDFLAARYPKTVANNTIEVRDSGPGFPDELIVRDDIRDLVDRRWQEYFPRGLKMEA